MTSIDLNTVDVARETLRTFFNITRVWGLTPEESRIISDVDIEIFELWKSQIVDEPLHEEVLKRISCVLNIYAALQTLLPAPERADAWIKTLNTASLFGGRRALDLMLTGRYEDLYAISEYLAGQLRGDFA